MTQTKEADCESKKLTKNWFMLFPSLFACLVELEKFSSPVIAEAKWWPSYTHKNIQKMLGLLFEMKFGFIVAKLVIPMDYKQCGDTHNRVK